MENLLNAKEAAEFLKVTYQRFYVIKYKYQLTAVDKKYDKKELRKVRKQLDAWKKAHASGA